MKLIICFYFFLFGIQTLSGQIGIKTNSPTSTLDVNGKVRVRDLEKGVVSSDAQGVLLSKKTNLGFTESNNSVWNELLVGTVSAIISFSGFESTSNTAISITIHYDKDDKSFNSMLLSGCAFSNLGSTTSDDGRFQITIGSNMYNFTFINMGDYANVTCSNSQLSGSFFSIVY